MIEKILAKKGQGKIIRTLPELAALNPTAVFAMDIETTGAEKLPGDSPFTKYHGIAGLALCNCEGEAGYVVVNDGRDYQGIPVQDLAKFVNMNWLVDGASVKFHNSKFDLGFLIERGFDFSKVRITDTWIGHSLACNGVFVSNKLKDIVKTRFNVATDSEEVLKKWLDEHGTKDYGDIPIELIGPYACDDVRYGLAVDVALQASEADEVKDLLHARYLGITRRLLAAEKTGILLDVNTIREAMGKVDEKLAFHSVQLKELLKGTDLDIDDEQKMLSYLHFQNLHPGPSEQFGEAKFYFDREAMCFVDHPTARHYKTYFILKTIKEQFGAGSAKGLKYRLEKTEQGVKLHPSFMMSVFSKGGLILCKKPDMHAVLGLTDNVRRFFAPNPGHHFVSLTCSDLPLLLLAYYSKDKAFQHILGSTGGPKLCEYYAKKANISPEAISLLFNQIIEGHGKKRLVERLRAAHTPGISTNTVGGFKAKLAALLPSLLEFERRLLDALAAEGCCRDVVGSKITVPEDKRYRAPALLISSSYGNILSLYLERFCEVADNTGAWLAFACENEFLFQVPDAAADVFAERITAVTDAKLVPVVPTWVVWSQYKVRGPWHQTCEDANRWVVNKWRK